jgi:predicted HicB family RNase H-like nuclease
VTEKYLTLGLPNSGSSSSSYGHGNDDNSSNNNSNGYRQLQRRGQPQQGTVKKIKNNDNDDNNKNNTLPSFSSFSPSINSARNKPLMLRIPEDLLKSLREEAAKDDSSVNSFIIAILKKYSSWGRFQERLGFMPLHKSMVQTMLNKMSPQEIEEIGQMQKDQTIRDFLLFKSRYDLESFFQWIELRCKVMGFEFLLKQEEERRGKEKGGNSISIFVMIHHNMGHNWSLYYKGMFSAVLQELLPPTDVTTSMTAATTTTTVARTMTKTEERRIYDDIIFTTNAASFSMRLVGISAHMLG